MNINGTNSYYGSAAYQEQITRYNNAAEEAAKRREEKAAPKQKSDEYISSGNIPEGEVIRPIKTVLPKSENSGGFWEALQKQSEFFMSIPVIKAEFTRSGYPEDIFRSSGNAQRDASIRAGFIYQRSCFDYTYEFDFSAMTNAEDFTGMSDAEIYRAIYSKYQHCYGERFLDALAVDFLSPPDPDDNIYRGIISGFEKEVLNACGTNDETILFDLRRNALYPDMTDDEIRQTIIDSYTDRLGYDMTNADVCKMAEEISLCGIGHGVRNMFNTHGNPEIYGSQAELLDVARQSAWLNKKVSARTFDQAYNTYRDKIYFSTAVDPEVGGVILQMKEALFPQIKINI